MPSSTHKILSVRRVKMIDKRIQRSKKDLKESFLILLQEKSFSEITISEIVRKANYSRGTFYANFKTKQAILDEVVEDVLDEMIQHIRHPYKQLTKVNLKDIHMTDITLFHYLKENGQLFRLLLSDRVQIGFYSKMATSIEQLFIQEYEYEFQRNSRINPSWLFIFRAHGIAGVIKRWIEEGCIESPQYLAVQIVELMLTSTEVFYVKDYKS